MTEATESSETPETEVTEAPSQETETQDPNVLGKMDPEENQQVQNYKVHAQQLITEIGRLDIRMSRLEAQVNEIKQQKDQVRQQLDQTEAEAQQLLNKVGDRFGIKSGEPWQALPDGTVRRVDPELLRAAQAAQKAQQQAPPQ